MYAAVFLNGHSVSDYGLSIHPGLFPENKEMYRKPLSHPCAVLTIPEQSYHDVHEEIVGKGVK